MALGLVFGAGFVDVPWWFFLGLGMLMLVAVVVPVVVVVLVVVGWVNHFRKR